MNDEASNRNTENQETPRKKRLIFDNLGTPEKLPIDDYSNLLLKNKKKNDEQKALSDINKPTKNQTYNSGRSWCSNWFCGQGGCSGEEAEIVSRREDTSSSSRNDTQIVLLPQPFPRDKGKKTLVLDLDETLIHSTLEYICDANSVIEVIIHERPTKIYVKYRPGMEDFLKYMKDLYEIVIFTAATREYADRVVKGLDPENKYISFILSREECTVYNHGYVKDLSRIGRKLKDMIIVDNSAYSFELQPENGYLIQSFYDDDEDLELFHLIPFLTFLSNINDVRVVSEWENKFNQKESLDYIDMEGMRRELTIENKSHLFNLKLKIQYIDPFKAGFCNYLPAILPTLCESTLEVGTEKTLHSPNSLMDKTNLLHQVKPYSQKISKPKFIFSENSFVENLRMDFPLEPLIKASLLQDVNENFMVIIPNDGADEKHHVPHQTNKNISNKV